jgi:hypothetical protein
MQNNLPPVPLMREFVLVQNQKATAGRGASYASIGVTVFFVVMGALVSSLMSKPSLFIVCTVLGFIVGLLIYFVGKNVPALKQNQGLEQVILAMYQPFLAKLNTGGFSAASESIKAIVRIAFVLHANAPHVFNAVDEGVRFFVLRLVQIADAKRLIGDERELKRQVERLQSAVNGRTEQSLVGREGQNSEALLTQVSELQNRLDRLEQLNRAALQLTNEVHRLRAECENSLVGKVTGDDAQRAALLLRENLDREKRVASELAQLGL